jgi:dolichyl-phosphate-mannose--protein O-mannosyl transferase
MTVLSWTCFTNQHELGPSAAFGPTWWFWLAATGLCLGATVSVKWVGLFTIAWVGALTLVQLWVLLGDTQRTTPVSLMPRCVCLFPANVCSVFGSSTFLLEPTVLFSSQLPSTCSCSAFISSVLSIRVKAMDL